MIDPLGSGGYGEHLATVKLDDRKRVSLAKWATTEPVERWKLYRLNDGKTIILEAIQ